jgi:hypothetical protein
MSFYLKKFPYVVVLYFILIDSCRNYASMFSHLYSYCTSFYLTNIATSYIHTKKEEEQEEKENVKETTTITTTTTIIIIP